MLHPYFSYGALVISIVPGLFGLSALIQPEATLKLIEFPQAATPQDKRLTASVMRIYGTRNIAISYLLALIWSTNGPEVMALGLFVGLWMATADGLISKRLTGGGQWNHWQLLPWIGGVFAGLLTKLS